MVNIRRLLFFICAIILLVFTSCSKKIKGTTSESNVYKIRSSKDLLQVMGQNLKSFDSSEIKGRFKYDPEKGMGFSGRFLLRQKKDKAVWVVARKFGLEGARIYITQDSLFLLNRLEKTYISDSHENLKKEQELSNLNFDLSLASVFSVVGVSFQDNWKTSKLSKTDEGYVLISKDGNQKMEVKKGISILPHSVSYLYEKDKVLLVYDNYKQQEDGSFFPYQRKLTVTRENGDIIRVELNYDSIDENAILKFPFQIPRSYKLMGK